MAKNLSEQLVHCRYPKCCFLHESTELKKDDAVKGGSMKSYYHPDCYHIMRTINKVRDLFIQNVNPLLTGKQISMLVATINRIVFSKKVDVDFLLFVVEYFIHNKPGALKHPNGLYYIIQDTDAITAWKKEQDRLVRQQIKTQLEEQIKEQAENIQANGFNLDNNDNFVYKPNKKSKFSNVLGV